VVALPGLSSYSPEQLRELRAWSPAFARYEQLVQEGLADPLRARRHKAWMSCVGATYFKSAAPSSITLYWSDEADAILRQAWQECGLADKPAALFALGKHGAQELNLSSDIDVLLVADPSEAMTIEKGLRAFQARLQQAGEGGFCFRLDFDLRPGGKMGPLLTTPSQFQDYYWSQGETWERLALVRLRPVTGPASLVDPVLDLARRFSFRKFLDYTLLEDLKALRSQVHQFGFTRREGEVHIKLEVGGIRDIELFVHSLLVLHGGKITDLQTRSTEGAIEKLEQHGLLTAKDAGILKNSYWEFRQAENRAQAVDDRQTHVLLAEDVPALTKKMSGVDRIVSGLLGDVNLTTTRLPVGDAAQSQWLTQLGFSENSITQTWPSLMKSTALSHKNDRDERARQEFLFAFVQELARQPGQERDLGLGILEDFVRGTRAKATFFTMLLRSPRLIQDLARLFCLSPYLGSILAARPELLDHFILQTDEGWAAELDQVLQQMNDRKLLTEIWAANQYLAERDQPTLFERVTETADEICHELLKRLRAEYPASTVEMLAMGKWGGRELGLRSDLDFVFVCDGKPNEEDFKVAKRFISRLADPQKGGNLYEIDLRLRPSGQSGAIIVSRDSLHIYWHESAQPWERQAYLRARPLNPAVVLDKSQLVSRELSKADLDELARIRSKLLVKPRESVIDVKYAPGGLLDIEFAVQTELLVRRVSDCSTITAEMLAQCSWTRLSEIYTQLREFQQMAQLASASKAKTLDINKPAFTKAASLMNMSPPKAAKLLHDLLIEARSILNIADPTGLKI
jgi:glutamate-ammonia-ligase adenylyltransferase